MDATSPNFPTNSVHWSQFSYDASRSPSSLYVHSMPTVGRSHGVSHAPVLPAHTYGWHWSHDGGMAPASAHMMQSAEVRVELVYEPPHVTHCGGQMSWHLGKPVKPAPQEERHALRSKGSQSLRYPHAATLTGDPLTSTPTRRTHQHVGEHLVVQPELGSVNPGRHRVQLLGPVGVHRQFSAHVARGHTLLLGPCWHRPDRGHQLKSQS